MRSGGELKCPTGTVLVFKGTYEGQEVGPLCFDQSEFTNEMKSQVRTDFVSGFQLVRVSREGGIEEVLLNKRHAADLLKKVSVGQAVLPVSSTGQLPQSPPGFDRPRQPLVMVPGEWVRLKDGQMLLGAKEICEARGMRLPTPVEWAYAASGPNHFDYSTRSGKLEKPGVYYCPIGGHLDATRDVGAGKGHYVQWGAAELYDMSGNVGEWTYDPSADEFYINGGSWYCDLGYVGDLRKYIDHNYHINTLRADSRVPIDLDYPLNAAAGFRCVASPQESKK